MKLYVLITGVLLMVSLLLVACGTGAIAGSASGVAPTPIPAPTDTPTPTASFRLTILHNNDGESQLVDLGSELEDFGGIARFATVVQRERQRANLESDGVILVSSGDNSLAGPEFTAGLRAGTFYDAKALDLIGYDAIALGNHDFDFGPEVLAEFIKQVSDSKAPFLSSNLDFSGETGLQDLFDKGRIAQSVVVEKNGVEIGIIGVTTPNLRFISSPRNVRIISDVAGEVQDEVDRLDPALLVAELVSWGRRFSNRW